MGSVKRRYSEEEFATRGDAIYETDARLRLKADGTANTSTMICPAPRTASFIAGGW
jgi:hypothetical protein